MVVFDPKSGLTLDARQLVAFSGRWRRSVDLSDLASLRIVDWADGPSSVEANLKDGSTFLIPSVCLPKKQVLIDAARHCGILLV